MSNTQVVSEIKQGVVEIDYEAIALIVNYTVEKVFYFKLTLK